MSTSPMQQPAVGDNKPTPAPQEVSAPGAEVKRAEVKRAEVSAAGVKQPPGPPSEGARAKAPAEPAPAPQPDAPPKPTARELAADVRAQRKKRARRLGLRVALGIGLPTLLGVVYFGFIASSQYESVSMFTVQSADGRQVLGLDMLIGAVSGGSSARDGLAVRDYILSREMLNLLDEKKGFRKNYQAHTIDWWSRLEDDASLEDAYDFYRDVLHVEHDSSSGVLTLRVRAFTPEYAKEVADAVLESSEKMVNAMSERARADQTKLAEFEVKKAEERLTGARQVIVQLQQEHSEFNPEATATEALSLRGQLKGELAKARAELMEAKAFMQPNAPQVVALGERVKSLSAQVSQESRRLVNPGDEKGLNNTYAKFDAAMVQKEFAQSAYQSAMASLEIARTEALRQHRYLATIANPSVADEETHPKRVRAIITVLLLSAMLLGIGSLIVAAVREHARI